MVNHSTPTTDKASLIPKSSSVPDRSVNVDEVLDNNLGDELVSQSIGVNSYLSNGGDKPPDSKTVLQMQSTFGNQATLRLLNNNKSQSTLQRKKKSEVLPFSGLFTQRTPDEELVDPAPFLHELQPENGALATTSDAPVIQRNWLKKPGADIWMWNKSIEGVVWFAEGPEVVWFNIVDASKIDESKLSIYESLQGKGNARSYDNWQGAEVTPGAEAGVPGAESDASGPAAEPDASMPALESDGSGPATEPGASMPALESVSSIVEDTPEITTATGTPEKSSGMGKKVGIAALTSIRNFLFLPAVQIYNFGGAVVSAISGDNDKAVEKYLPETIFGKLARVFFPITIGDEEASLFNTSKGEFSFGVWLNNLNALAKDVAAWAGWIALLTGIIGIFVPPFQAVAAIAGTVGAIAGAVVAGLSLFNAIYTAIMISQSKDKKRATMLKWKLGKDIVDMFVGLGSAIIGGIGGITAFDTTGAGGGTAGQAPGGAAGAGQVAGGNAGALAVGIEGDVAGAAYDHESEKEVAQLQRSSDLGVIQRIPGDGEEMQKLMTEIEQQIADKDQTVAAIKSGVSQDSGEIAEQGAGINKAKQTFDEKLAPASSIPDDAQGIKQSVDSQDPTTMIDQHGTPKKDMDDSKLTELEQKLDAAESDTGEKFDGGVGPEAPKPSKWRKFKSWFKKKFNFIKKRITSLYVKLRAKVTVGLMKAMGMSEPMAKLSNDLDNASAEQKGLGKANVAGMENADEATQKSAEVKEQLDNLKEEIGE
jgi:hypothetical protein